MGANSGARRTIWVADDSPTDLDRVARLLGGQHHVEAMTDGSTVLERLASRPPPDLLVLDWVMPGVSGVEVCRYLRHQGNLPNVPVLLLTAYREVHQIADGLEAGANDYVAKPFADQELLARVAALLRQRETLERAERAEAAVRELLATTPDGIVSVDPQGRITYANEETLRVLQKRLDELQGRPIKEVIPGLRLHTHEVEPGGPPAALPDVRIDGRVFSPYVRVLPSDKPSRLTVSLRDVTRRRELDARRLDFYSIIAHDLRTPLGAMLLRLELILRGKYGLLPAGLVADLRKTETNVRSLVAMINDFLELARFEGLGLKLEREPVDLSALVRRTMEDVAPLLEAGELAWEQEGLSQEAVVEGDRQRLGQVVANLVGNAVKFTPKGGRVRTVLTAAEHHYEVAVEDTGRGIEPEVLPTIFMRYSRAPQGEAKVTGSGLGLMIVREIVEAHGGTVGVQSEPGRGSRFWFRVPR